MCVTICGRFCPDDGDFPTDNHENLTTINENWILAIRYVVVYLRCRIRYKRQTDFQLLRQLLFPSGFDEDAGQPTIKNGLCEGGLLYGSIV